MQAGGKGIKHRYGVSAEFRVVDALLGRAEAGDAGSKVAGFNEGVTHVRVGGGAAVIQWLSFMVV